MMRPRCGDCQTTPMPWDGSRLAQAPGQVATHRGHGPHDAEGRGSEGGEKANLHDLKIVKVVDKTTP
jgi:hypothetical protein